MDRPVLLHARACFIPQKNYMKRGQTDISIDRYIDGHRDSMKESAKGRFFENGRAKGLVNVVGAPFLQEQRGAYHPRSDPEAYPKTGRMVSVV